MNKTLKYTLIYKRNGKKNIIKRLSPALLKDWTTYLKSINVTYIIN